MARIIAFLILVLVSPSWVSCTPNAHSGSISDGGEKLAFSGQSFEGADLSTFRKKKSDTPVRIMEFDQCTFKGPTRFAPLANVFQSFSTTVVFRNCSFEGEFSAGMVQFLGQMVFSKCRFKQTVSFRNSGFFAPVSFRDCTFDGEAQFQNTLFLKESTFQASHFYSYTLFQGARFSEKAQFANSVFHANADFTMCRFEEGAGFDFVRTEGNLDFSESRQHGLMTFRKAELLKRTVFRQVRSFGPIRFFDTRFEDSLIQVGLRYFAEKPEIRNPTGAVIPASPDSP